MARTDPSDAVFAALADATRRDLLRAIVATGPCTATELANDRDITRQAIAKHLAVLGRAGLVDARRDGREVRYHADPAPLANATEWIAETGAAWDRRLARLSDLLDAATQPATRGGAPGVASSSSNSPRGRRRAAT